MNNICFITVATSKYFQFTERLANSIKKYFINNADFCVFTDIQENHLDWVKYFHVKHRLWPYSSACKFEHIISQKEYFKQYDYLYFIDADMCLCDEFSIENIVPNNDTGLVGVKHPAWGLFMGPRGDIEENPESSAFIPKNKKLDCYYQGCFWGGTSEAILKMCSILKINADYDYKKGINTKWFDESHINYYFFYHKPRTLGSEYCCPEKDHERYKITDKKILHIHKTARGEDLKIE